MCIIVCNSYKILCYNIYTCILYKKSLGGTILQFQQIYNVFFLRINLDNFTNVCFKICNFTNVCFKI